MLRGYNLVPWENITLLIEEANQLFRDHYMYGWTHQAYLFIPKTYPKKEDLNEFVDSLNCYL
jgi:hypothetical protein